MIENYDIQKECQILSAPSDSEKFSLMKKQYFATCIDKRRMGTSGRRGC